MIDENFINRNVNGKSIKEAGDMHLTFINLEKAFDKQNREGIWLTFKKRGTNK